MDRYYKNFILCGEVDFYCILCREGFEVNKNVERHLRWEKHRKVIQRQEYVSKFKKDLIFKITDEDFYCEVCNMVIQNAADHVKGSNHQTKKTSNKKERTSCVHREEDGSIKIKDQIITKLQWHGIIDSICLICNEIVEPDSTHMNLYEHITKLIQSEFVSDDDRTYRKLGANHFYCFTCFKIFETSSLDSHWIDNHNKNDKSPKQGSSKINSDKSLSSTVDLSDKENIIMIKVLRKIEQEYFSFDIDNRVAKCLTCQEIVDSNFDAIYKHKSSHQSDKAYNDTLCRYLYDDKGKRRAELAKYGRDNFIRLNEGGSKGYCSLCNIYLSAHINTAKQHVAGAFHRGHLEFIGLIKDQKHEKPNCESIPFKSFFKVMYGPFEIDDINAVCINDGICVNILSFMLVSVIDDLKCKKGKCFACNLTMDCNDLEKHTKTREHINIFLGCQFLPIVIKDDEEFIRQIHPSLYHCGYCNSIFPFWEVLMKHLKSFSHEVKRQRAKLMSCICAKKYLDPTCCLMDIEEYIHLRKMDSF